jgi:hypothetical protein
VTRNGADGLVNRVSGAVAEPQFLHQLLGGGVRFVRRRFDEALDLLDLRDPL